MRRRAPSLSVLALAVIGGGAAAEDDTTARSVWDGVYPPAQVERGMAIYEEFCVECHARGMRGAPGSPPLAGPAFLFKWDGQPLDALFVQVRDTMPVGRIGYLSDEELIDAIAAILDANGFPADDAAAALPPDVDALSAVAIRREEPSP